MEAIKIDFAKAEEEVVADMIAKEVESIHSKALAIHAKALACHCECLSMNAENTWRVCSNQPPPYLEAHYQHVMLKWGLINEEGEPLI